MTRLLACTLAPRADREHHTVSTYIRIHLRSLLLSAVHV
jgi:hypothetical protein